MVSISTYRDERRLFAVIGAVIGAALLALVQLQFARAGHGSPLTASVTGAATFAQTAVALTVDGARSSVAALIATPQLARENGRLVADNRRLREENDALTEQLARVPAERDVARSQLAHPDGIAATVIGYDPEATQRVITIDKGSRDRVQRDDGVVSGDGVVGRVIEADPLSSKVLLVTDPASKLPAIVQHGRWWAIAVGTQTRVRLQYISQDAKLHVGDVIVTGEGRSFHAGARIGKIASIVPMTAGSLDQSAIIAPSVEFGALTRVVVLAK